MQHKFCLQLFDDLFLPLNVAFAYVVLRVETSHPTAFFIEFYTNLKLWTQKGKGTIFAMNKY